MSIRGAVMMLAAMAMAVAAGQVPVAQPAVCRSPAPRRNPRRRSPRHTTEGQRQRAYHSRRHWNAAPTLPRHADPGVALRGNTPPLTANTNSRGQYQAKEVPPGSYFVSAGRAGYLTLQYWTGPAA